MAEFAERLALAHRATAEHFQTMALQIDATIKALPTIDFERLGGYVAIAESGRWRSPRRSSSSDTRY
jgi:hypothetical protein